MSPFPLAQLYYGYFWVAGSRIALVYACYRKRLSAEETETWEDSEIVLPRFATLLTAKMARAATVVLTLEDGITAVHWGEEGHVPSSVVSRAWLPETAEEEKNRVRDEVLRSVGGSRAITDLTALPALTTDSAAGEFAFKAPGVEAPYSREQLDQLDVRDKADLAARRRARARDLLLWRGFVACLIGLGLAGFLEIGLIGGKFWQQSRMAKVNRQTPVVAEIMRAQSLSMRIEELSTKRLKPLEMISLLVSKRPDSIVFSRATTSGLYGLEVECYTSVATDVGVFQAGLRQLPELSKVEIQNQALRDAVSTFRLVVVFKPISS
jgi:hypothetical protein